MTHTYLFSKGAKNFLRRANSSLVSLSKGHMMRSMHTKRLTLLSSQWYIHVHIHFGGGGHRGLHTSLESHLKNSAFAPPKNPFPLCSKYSIASAWGQVNKGKVQLCM